MGTQDVRTNQGGSLSPREPKPVDKVLLNGNAIEGRVRKRLWMALELGLTTEAVVLVQMPLPTRPSAQQAWWRRSMLLQ